MPQFGFDEDRLHELNPDLIYLTMPGYGRSGPGENWLAYGSCIDSHAGLSSLNGYRGQVPWKGGIAWPDPIAGLHAAAAVLAALWSTQAAGGGGLTIEAAQFESTVAAIGDRVLEAQIDGPYLPDGNRQPGFVAQGVYPCRGDDEWIAISAPDAATFASWVGVLGLGEATADDHDSFDRLVTATTVGLDAAELTERLQAAGVPAGPTYKAPDIMADPHMRARHAWVTVDQPDVGDFTAPVMPIVMSASVVAVRRPAPTLGQHNAEVLAAAGFTVAEIASLTSTKVITTEPPM
jgi:crotonobetainyl-CoA:carnitine CoA-transferase CaiB-like acyl-CoA transferase